MTKNIKESNYTMYEAVCISDLHVGATNCRWERILEFLDYIQDKTNKIIINGDLFDHTNQDAINNNQWRVLAQLRELAFQRKVVLIKGNHDLGIDNDELLKLYIPTIFRESYLLNVDDKRIYFHHGHIYDEFILKHPKLTKIADFAYKFLQRLDKNHKIASFVKRNIKAFMRNSEKIRDKSISLARKMGYDAVVTGHTHHVYSSMDVFNEKTLEYFNTGSWVDSKNYYLGIKPDGSIKLEEY